MSDKSRDAEPDHDDIVPGDPDATEGEIVIDDPEALADAEAAVQDEESDAIDPAADDEAIEAMEQGFTPEEREAMAAAPVIARKTAKAPVKKAAPTRKRSAAQKEQHDPYKASNPVEFAKQSAGELQKVVWPTWPQLVSMFFAVLIFVLIMILIVGVLDVAFGWSLLQIFGS